MEKLHAAPVTVTGITDRHRAGTRVSARLIDIDRHGTVIRKKRDELARGLARTELTCEWQSRVSIRDRYKLTAIRWSIAVEYLWKGGW
jgi:hypothetical protein